MATLQDISMKLMKPAKDLADWEFPLAQVLDEYNSMLSESSDVNFGESALIIQNSSNVYTRRVEYLHQEVLALNKSMAHDKEEDSKKKERRGGKYKLDFGNFEIPDLIKNVSNSIQLKPEKEEKKKVKLLNERYPQLESYSNPNKYSFDVVDGNGEIIGKKNHFRCNENLTNYKMLVEELTPHNFSYYSNDNYNSNEEVENYDVESDCDNFRETEVFSLTAESGYYSLLSNSTPGSRRRSDSCQINEDTSFSPIQSESNVELSTSRDDELNESISSENLHGYSRVSAIQQSPVKLTDDTGKNSEEVTSNSQNNEMNQKETVSPVSSNDEPADLETSACTVEEFPNDPLLSNDSGETPNSEENETNQNETITPASSNDKPEDLETYSSAFNIEESPDDLLLRNDSGNDSGETASDSPEEEMNQNENVSSEIPNDLENISTQISKKDAIRNSIETDAGYTSGDSEDILSASGNSPKKNRKDDDPPDDTSSVSLRNKNKQDNNRSESFDPIPFESTIPEKLPKSRTEFKLPCNIALLKYRPKKRKYNNPSRKSVVEYLNNRSKRPKGERKQTEDSELKRKEYEYVMNSDDEFVGFKRRNSDENRPETPTPMLPSTTPARALILTSTPILGTMSLEADSRCPSPISCTFSAPPSPESCVESDDLIGPENDFENHQRRIEEKMRQLKEEVNSRNDFENEKCKWFEAIESLNLLEKRSAFSTKEYESIIIDSLKSENNKRAEFTKIASQKPEDIARLFVTSLHLANTYNLQIDVGKNNNENIYLTLLNEDTREI